MNHEKHERREMERTTGQVCLAARATIRQTHGVLRGEINRLRTQLGEGNLAERDDKRAGPLHTSYSEQIELLWLWLLVGPRKSGKVGKLGADLVMQTLSHLGRMTIVWCMSKDVRL